MKEKKRGTFFLLLKVSANIQNKLHWVGRVLAPYLLNTNSFYLREIERNLKKVQGQLLLIDFFCAILQSHQHEKDWASETDVAPNKGKTILFSFSLFQSFDNLYLTCLATEIQDKYENNQRCILFNTFGFFYINYCRKMTKEKFLLENFSTLELKLCNTYKNALFRLIQRERSRNVQRLIILLFINNRYQTFCSSESEALF